MDEYKKLIDAATHGDLEAVRAVAQKHPALINRKDESGATPLHYATFGGHSDVARLLVQHGADINARDDKFNATPTGWAIEYLREMGGLLGVELNDFAHAIRRGDVEWATRFAKRFPALRNGRDIDGKTLKQLAQEAGNAEIADLFR